MHMRILVRLGVVAGLLFAAVAMVSGPAHACSCSIQSDAQRFARADAVFVGTLIDSKQPLFASRDTRTLTFIVDTVYKGQARQRQAVVTQRDDASCGLNLPPGGRLLVLASLLGPVDKPQDRVLYGDSCMGTRPLAGNPPALFGAGYEPLPGEAAARNLNPFGPVSPGPAALAAATATATMAALAVLRWRRGRRHP